MSKNSPDRHKSSFKARDNVEIIMRKIIPLVEKEFIQNIEAQTVGRGEWKTDGSKAEIKFDFDTPFRNLEGKALILNCESNGGVLITEENTDVLRIFRNKLIDAVFALMEHVNTANNIHPITLMEFDTRRLNQDLAISDCYHISHIMQQAIHFLHMKASKTEETTELIDEEIRLLQGWRRSEYKKRKAIEKRENGQ